VTFRLARLDPVAAFAAATRQAQATLSQFARGGDWIVDATLRRYFTPARWKALGIQNQRVAAVRAVARNGSPKLRAAVELMNRRIGESCSDEAVNALLSRIDTIELRDRLDRSGI
jgi:hypothetical protein